MGIREVNRLPDLIADLRSIENKRVLVGLFGPANSEIMIIGGTQEFGAEIRPKKGKWLTIPAKPELVGESPRKFSDLIFVAPKNGESAILGKKSGDSIDPWFILVKKIVVPERAWLRGTFDQPGFQERMTEVFRQAALDFLGGTIPAIQILHRAGIAAVSEVKSRIINNDPAMKPLSPLTIKLKGSSTPIRDNLRLLNDITYEIREAA